MFDVRIIRSAGQICCGISLECYQIGGFHETEVDRRVFLDCRLILMGQFRSVERRQLRFSTLFCSITLLL